MNQPDELLAAKLNLETGRASWQELERHFARGVLVLVAAELDLIEVAGSFVADDKVAAEKLLAAGNIGKPSMDDAKLWHDQKTSFWAVVVAPWVLVQPIPGRP